MTRDRSLRQAADNYRRALQAVRTYWKTEDPVYINMAKDWARWGAYYEAHCDDELMMREAEGE